MKLKKITAAALTSVLALSSAGVLAEENSIHVIAGKGLPVRVTIVDEKHYDEVSQGYDSIVFSDDTMPFIDENGRTQLPLRRIAEELDFTVDYSDAEKKITLSKKDYTVIFYINSKDFTVNGKSVSMDTAPVIVNDSTFVPLRYLSEAVGYTVDYTDRNKVAEVESYTTPIEDMWNFGK